MNGSAINAEGMVGGIAIASLQRRQVLTIVDEAELNNADFASPHLQREFLVRPIRIPELLARLADLVRKGEEKYSIPRVDASRRRVLIVDDDEIVRVLLSTILETEASNAIASRAPAMRLRRWRGGIMTWFCSMCVCQKWTASRCWRRCACPRRRLIRQ